MLDVTKDVQGGDIVYSPTLQGASKGAVVTSPGGRYFTYWNPETGDLSIGSVRDVARVVRPNLPFSSFLENYIKEAVGDE